MALIAPADGGEPFGRYRLVERIGAGGMAVVYRALATHAGAPPSVVVIKRVLPTLSRDPAFVKMLVAEARLSSRLSHPGIVRIHELGRVHDEYFLSMEYVDGVDMLRLLNRCVATRTQVPIGVACFVAQQIAAALCYAHDLKDAEGRPLEIVHRDVSPANIMVTVAGQVKLLDFGVAKAAEHVRDDRTRTGTLKGKINYLSPEQAEGLSIDGRSDLFALGIVLHECLTLKRLFRGPSDLVTLRLVRQCEVAPPSHLRPDVPPELDTIVLRMLARDRGQRFAKGDEIAAALAPVVQAHEGTPDRLAELIARIWQADVSEPSEEDRREIETLDIEASRGSEAPTVAAIPPMVNEASEAAPARRRMRRGQLALLAGGALLLAVAALVVARVPSTPHAVPPALIVKSDVVAPPPIAEPPAKGPAARITIELDVAAAQIRLDGVLVGDGVRRARLAVAHAGKHVLDVTAPRRRPYRRAIVVADGADLDLHITLVRATSAFQRAKVRTADGDYLVDPFGPKR